ncbi:ribonuclease H-like domain-containing protein [Apiospora saccharicola]
MNVARRSLGPARSSALRCLRIASQERTLLNRRISFCPVTVATVAAAALPVAAVVGEKLTRGKPGPSTTASSALVPVALPGTSKEIEAFFVDTPAGVSEVADRLWALAAGDNADDNCLYVDLEGVNLCRNGSVSLLILYAPVMRQAFVVDVFTLQAAAFTTKGARSDLSIQDILESAERKKAFFDVRNDSDAMFYHYGVRLRGAEDIQLMHNASRPKGYRNNLSGLSQCMARVLSPAEGVEWANSKQAGHLLFKPENGGSFDVFNVRPLSPEIISYCVGDVYYLPRLKQRWWAFLSDEWKQKVIEETEARVVKSQQDNFRPHSPDKTRSPWEDEWDWVSLDEFKPPTGDYPGSRSIWPKSKGVIEQAS